MIFKKVKIPFFIIWLIIVLLFFSPVFLGKVPVPLDTIVGLYHPWRDQNQELFPNGIPFKNFLITDPVRKQIPWIYLTLKNFKKGKIFSWNPYSFSGTPLTVNFQTAFLYPFNFIFLFLPFLEAWTINLIICSFLAGFFIFLYLRHFSLEKEACFLASLAFSFSGFFVAWLEWGTIPHVLIWLPLILWLYEKLCQKVSLRWFVILFLAYFAQLTAGHLQVSIYVFLFSLFYIVVRLFFLPRKRIWPFFIFFLILAVFTLIYSYPSLKFLKLTARNFDLPDWQNSSWFLPLPHLVQFIAPDFFGNPSTLNYWGEWNYGEFIGYIGFVPLLFSLYAILARKDKKTRFFTLLTLAVFLLIVKNPISQLPYLVNIPFFSTAQPTRLISLLVFDLAVLSALGFDLFLQLKDKKIILINVLLLCFLSILWLYSILFVSQNQLLLISQRNLILPSLLAVLSLVALSVYLKMKWKGIILFILILTIFDLFRFGRKFLAFSEKKWFYPKTAVINYLQEQKLPFRLMAIDRKILPPNFSIMFQLEDVAGYDPLYLLNYAKLVQAWNNNSPDIKPGRFNRIITPQNYESFITDLLNVRYVLSLTDLNSPKLVFRFAEGQTKIYENIQAFPRLFFVEETRIANNENEVIQLMFEEKENLRKKAIVEKMINFDRGPLKEWETAEIVRRDANMIVIKTKTEKNRFLVLSEINYPAWRVYIDGVKSVIYPVDLALRGIVVPAGDHLVEFKYEEFLL